jgi:hypothetical protein
LGEPKLLASISRIRNSSEEKSSHSDLDQEDDIFASSFDVPPDVAQPRTIVLGNARGLATTPGTPSGGQDAEPANDSPGRVDLADFQASTFTRDVTATWTACKASQASHPTLESSHIETGYASADKRSALEDATTEPATAQAQQKKSKKSLFASIKGVAKSKKKPSKPIASKTTKPLQQGKLAGKEHEDPNYRHVSNLTTISSVEKELQQLLPEFFGHLSDLERSTLEAKLQSLRWPNGRPLYDEDAFRTEKAISRDVIHGVYREICIGKALIDSAPPYGTDTPEKFAALVKRTQAAYGVHLSKLRAIAKQQAKANKELSDCEVKLKQAEKKDPIDYSEHISRLGRQRKEVTDLIRYLEEDQRKSRVAFTNSVISATALTWPAEHQEHYGSEILKQLVAEIGNELKFSASSGNKSKNVGIFRQVSPAARAFAQAFSMFSADVGENMVNAAADELTRMKFNYKELLGYGPQGVVYPTDPTTGWTHFAQRAVDSALRVLLEADIPEQLVPMLKRLMQEIDDVTREHIAQGVDPVEAKQNAQLSKRNLIQGVYLRQVIPHISLAADQAPNETRSKFLKMISNAVLTAVNLTKDNKGIPLQLFNHILDTHELVILALDKKIATIQS